VAELFKLQLYQHVALENAVVKDEVNEVVGVTNQNPLLAGFKAKTVAQFEQKILKLIKKLVLQMRLAHHFFWFETKEFEHIGVPNRKFGIGGIGAFCTIVASFFLSLDNPDLS